MTGVRAQTLVGIVAIGLAGCGAEVGTTGTSEASVVDSAGVRLVTSPTPAPVDTVQPQLLWEHGTRPDDYLFTSIGAAVVREDSAVLVVASGNRELVRIGRGGASYITLAKTGQGPSEVAAPRALLAGPEAGVWLEDAGNTKLLRFAGDSLLETVSGSAIPWDGDALRPRGVDPRGHLLLATGSVALRFEEPWLAGSLAVFDPSNSSVDTVGSFDYIPRQTDPPVSPFSKGGVVTVADGRFVIGRTDLPQLTWLSTDASVAQVFRWDQPLRFPDSDDWDAFRSSMLEMGVPEEMMSSWAVDETEPLPLFGQIVGARDGAVWIAPFVSGGWAATAEEWRVAASDGGWLGLVQFARPIRLLYVGVDLIAAVHTDELGVQSVAVYENPFGS